MDIAICCDQWCPETARALALQDADFLMYPTAIGTEPNEAEVDSMEHWRMVMRGHAAANMLPVVAANRIGLEVAEGVSMTFYGSSFIADHLGALAAAADRTSEQVLCARDIPLDGNLLRYGPPPHNMAAAGGRRHIA